MTSFWKLVKRHKIATIVIAVIIFLVVVVGVPFGINCLFKISARNELLKAEWTAADVLTYYGGILAFLSTVILSVLALWQNHVIKEANEAHTELLERLEREKYAPFIKIYNPMSNGQAIKFYIENISDNIAQKIEIKNAYILDGNGEEVWRDTEGFFQNYLAKNEKAIVMLNKPPNIIMNDMKLNFTMEFYDIFDVSHKCEASYVLRENRYVPIFHNKFVI